MQNRPTTAATRVSTPAPHGLRRGLLALLGIGALAASGCSSGAPVGAAPSATIAAGGAAPGATPIAINCGPGQQALIRPSLLAGQTISQVECVPVAGATTAPAGYPGMMGLAMGATAVPASYYEAPRIVEQPAVYQPAARPVRYRTAAAPRVAPRKSGRSWQRSAIIIGSSAGVGAGVGGAVKGKKGALIGAAIGGGAATIWDQATRRR
jgi:hypothetical protein